MLTEAHKIAFMAWLESQIDSDRKLVEHMKRVNVPPAVILVYERDIRCAIHILEKLRNTEVQTIS